MTGTEELVQRQYLDLSNPARPIIRPDTFGNFGMLKLGQTTFFTLQRYIDIDLTQASEFEPKYWEKPHRMGAAKPDTLITQGRSVVAVVEYKAPQTLDGGVERRKGFEQLQTYMLICKARLGVLTDGVKTLWIHNSDPRRRQEVKIIHENGLFCVRNLEPRNLDYIIQKLNHLTDDVSQPPAFDPSVLARSIWQDVYIATRQLPERCFQTFVELFMYKLMSDYNLLPRHLQIDNLATDVDRFRSATGQSQIEYYFAVIRPQIKSQLFVPMNTDAILSGLARRNGPYVTSKQVLPTLNTNGGKTSVIDGHAFEVQPVDYNSAFVGILRKLNALPHITHLDPGFKSRVYEQFLRRDPNTSKVTGKYFTPRNVVKAIVQMAEVSRLHRDAVVCDPACGVGGFITETILELQRHNILNYQEDKGGRIVVDRKFMGLEVLEDVVCLAKANLLLHCIEQYHGFSQTARGYFSQLLADVFIHCHEDRTLGSLKHPAYETC